METKKDIRSDIFKKRKEYTQEQILTMSEQITKQVMTLPAWKDADFVYAYVDYNHEVSTRALILEAWKAGKKVAVPKVEGKDMIFYELESFDQLAPGYYQIPEPQSGTIVDWESPLMIMPGVAFDRSCHRVGYGGGFYDRFLEKHNIPTVAVAFEFQMRGEVPTEPTDILPQAIVTEMQIYVPESAL